jgi:ribose transport system permease protein
VTVAGLNQLGAPFFVEPLFNGAMLIVAVGLAVTAARRRVTTGSQADAALQRAVEGSSPGIPGKPH